ncbi:hypothetical protein DOZ80_24685 [Pseudomonas fluorescens]|uniref:Uncharacterized protein n=1 Tax=Pseudomonas fluorescens TaxID=294 RepID=A0A327MSI5_PSEFL|nr:hypothetical protein DOZ80_24685 [Pseudomonas fluorescens]
MDVNEDMYCLIERGVLEIFASKLARTGVLRRMREHATFPVSPVVRSCNNANGLCPSFLK